MKTLNHHVLVFDKDCPLCNAYTGAFLKAGMLDSNGREAYSEMKEETCSLIDKDRARNEIALVNTKTGNVIYGIDSLFRIIGHAFPVFAPLFRFAPFRWLMKFFYSFISYNRKVIIPSRIESGACVPDLNLKYRWAYIIFTWLFTSIILTRYSVLLNGVLPPSEFLREFLICGGQIVFQAGVLFLIAKEKILTYLGNMMTISFAGGLVLLLVLFGSRFLSLTAPVYASLFMIVAGLMFLEHFRRMKLLEISWLASASWVMYRLIVLSFIL